MDIESNEFLKATAPMPVVLVSTLYGEIKNVAPYAWHMPISMDPPMLGLAVRNTRDTYSNIKDTGEFVVGLPGPTLKDQVMIAARSVPRDRSEFDISGLTPMESSVVSPYRIKECSTNIECRLEWIKKAGDHDVVVGKVVKVHVSEEIVASDGSIQFPSPLMHIGGGRDLYARLGDLI
ncbi:MAG: flavin reductase family protein [Thermoplasmatota archaeon]